MRKLCLWVVLILSFTHLTAQKTISRKVIASAGGSVSNKNCQISYTVGETVINTITAPKITITQGFQQPDANSYSTALNISDITRFDAYAEYRTAKLLLVTNTGFKTDYFVLERLNNSSSQFEALENRNVQVIAQSLTDYSFTDKEPQDGDNYYRIKQVTQRGDSIFTEVRKVTFNTKGELTLFPNPASEYVNIDLSEFQGKSATLSVFSPVGQILLNQVVEKIGKEPVRIALNGMVTGTFQLKIDVKGQRSISKQLIVAKE